MRVVGVYPSFFGALCGKPHRAIASTGGKKKSWRRFPDDFRFSSAFLRSFSSNREKIQVITFVLLDGDSSSSAVFPNSRPFFCNFACPPTTTRARPLAADNKAKERSFSLPFYYIHRYRYVAFSRSTFEVQLTVPRGRRRRERKEKGFLLFSAFWSEGSQGTAQQHSRGKREREGWRERGTSSRQRC